jgi:hypothetical protein
LNAIARVHSHRQQLLVLSSLLLLLFCLFTDAVRNLKMHLVKKRADVRRLLEGKTNLLLWLGFGAEFT